MTDYIKQVAEAVVIEFIKHSGCVNASLDLDAIIAQVPKPEPVAYLTYKGYLLHAGVGSK